MWSKSFFVLSAGLLSALATELDLAPAMQQDEPYPNDEEGECSLELRQLRTQKLTLEPEEKSQLLETGRKTETASEDEAVADGSIQEAEGEQWGPLFGITREKCCRCTNGLQGWSASGGCSFCYGSVEKKKKSVPSDCIVGNKDFQGSSFCANKCKGQLQSWWR
eukprot:TRINITY_DN107575_c0_g1_i1.p2 TRINITY_DN107575_c0_g1~~TRINITY_DN107575_c0_g1_i1.p2  ORF type:complete len:164 (+),score=46.43 TRINITY_DN107575_c0_g1_i1:73-564(+)